MAKSDVGLSSSIMYRRKRGKPDFRKRPAGVSPARGFPKPDSEGEARPETIARRIASQAFYSKDLSDRIRYLEDRDQYPNPFELSLGLSIATPRMRIERPGS